MSNNSTTLVKANERPKHGPGRGGGPGHGPMGGGSGEKAANFSVSAKRLISELRPQRARIITAILLGTLSVAMSVIGPKIIGKATNILLAGIIGKQFDPSMTTEQIVEMLRAGGQDRVADLISGMEYFTPGAGVDFHHMGVILLIVLGLYILAAVAQWMQGYVLNDAVQKTVYRMRKDVAAKIDRLPLPSSTSNPAVRSSAASPTTSTTCPRRCSRRCRNCSTRCSCCSASSG